MEEARQARPRKWAILRPSSAPGTKARISPDWRRCRAMRPETGQGRSGRRFPGTSAKPRRAGHEATTKPTRAKHRDKGRARHMCAGHAPTHTRTRAKRPGIGPFSTLERAKNGRKMKNAIQTFVFCMKFFRWGIYHITKDIQFTPKLS